MTTSTTAIRNHPQVQQAQAILDRERESLESDERTLAEEQALIREAIGARRPDAVDAERERLRTLQQRVEDRKSSVEQATRGLAAARERAKADIRAQMWPAFTEAICELDEALRKASAANDRVQRLIEESGQLLPDLFFSALVPPGGLQGESRVAVWRRYVISQGIEL